MGRTDYKSIIAEIKVAIEKDQLFIVRDLLAELDKAPNNAAVKEFFTSEAETLDSIREYIVRTEELLETLRSTEGWKKCSEKKGTTVYFQKKDDGAILTKLETVFTAEPQDVIYLFTKIVSLFNETDLMPKWFPRNMMKSCDLTQQITKFSKTICTRIKMPRPVNLVLSPREAHVWGQGWDMSERSQIVITVTTLQPGQEVNGVKTPEVSEGYQPFILDNVYYFELSDRGIIFKVLQAIDLCSKMIPQPIMNFASKGVLPHEMIKNLKNVLDNFEGSEWEKRVNDSPEVYDEISDRLQAFLEKTYGIENKPLNKKNDEDISKRLSVISGSVTSKKKRKGLVSRMSRGISKRRPRLRSRSNSKRSKNSRAKTDKVELYDFEMSTKQIKKQTADIAQSKRQRTQQQTISQLFVYFLIFLLVKIATLIGQQNKLTDKYPNLERKYPQLFNN